MNEIRDEAALNTASRRWTVWRVLAYVVLIQIAFQVAQTVAIIPVLIGNLLNDSEFDIERWVAQVESNGAVVIAAIFGSTLVCIPLIVFLVWRREADPWRFLGLQGTSTRSLIVFCLGSAALVGGGDLVTVWIGRPVVPTVMFEQYSSAPPLALFLSVVFLAPLFEELFFRGFLLGALDAIGVPQLGSAVLSAGFWAALHVQYDFYSVVQIFLMGLLLAAARNVTGSILPCIAMHGLNNVIAYAETAILVQVVAA